jgi:hypothetical protein
MKTDENYIIHAAKLLANDALPTGIYGKATSAHKQNEKKKDIAKHIKRNSEAICKLIFEDRNVYLENDIHSKNELLNSFINHIHSKIDLETYKLLKNEIGSFLK